MMRISEVAEKYRFDETEFERFLLKQPDIEVSGMYWKEIDDKDIEKAVKLYKEEKDPALNQVKAEQALQKSEALSKMLISSGFNFEGYRIVKYSGYISGDDAVQIPRTGVFQVSNNGQNLTDALVKIRIQAIKELKEAAYELGCNAVIGVDFDYITLEPETATFGTTVYEPYIICVTANGNAVVIEKDE